MMRKALVFSISFIFLSAPAYAGRPFSTEDATVAEIGAIEQEVGMETLLQGKRNKK